jgi:hypothetical protein
MNRFVPYLIFPYRPSHCRFLYKCGHQRIYLFAPNLSASRPAAGASRTACHCWSWWQVLHSVAAFLVVWHFVHPAIEISDSWKSRSRVATFPWQF